MKKVYEIVCNSEKYGIHSFLILAESARQAIEQMPTEFEITGLEYLGGLAEFKGGIA